MSKIIHKTIVGTMEIQVVWAQRIYIAFYVFFLYPYADNVLVLLHRYSN